MIIYPALDLLDGKCVRLLKGDFAQSTTYSDDPISMVRTFETAGAKALHLVDLSGAKEPAKRQLTMIKNIVRSTPLKVQSGGGLRTLDEVRALLDCGVERAVIGSIAVSQPALVEEMLREFGPGRITIAIDVIPQNNEYLIATQGWKNVTDTRLEKLVSHYQAHGVERILCTDISRDGLMAGPNVKLYQNLLHEFPMIDFQASGGMSKAQDIFDLKQVGVKSLVIGKAIYEGSISLRDVLNPGDAHAH